MFRLHRSVQCCHHHAILRRQPRVSASNKTCPSRYYMTEGIRSYDYTHAHAHSTVRDTVTTDEGVIVHQSDPAKTGDGPGLVWGSVLWPSGIALAKYLHYIYVMEDDEAKNSTTTSIHNATNVLELGCGTGVVGLTAAKHGKHVTLTDYESALWPILRQSIQDNHVEKYSTIYDLDWRDPSTFLLQDKFDLIVAADVLYQNMDTLFARALAAHLYLDNTSLIASPFRKDSPLRGFFEASERLGLTVERLENTSGQAVGAYTGVNPQDAFGDAMFVPVDSTARKELVATAPSFSTVNEKQVQIFRVVRVSGTPEEAADIRRVSHIWPPVSGLSHTISNTESDLE